MSDKEPEYAFQTMDEIRKQDLLSDIRQLSHAVDSIKSGNKNRQDTYCLVDYVRGEYVALTANELLAIKTMPVVNGIIEYYEGLLHKISENTREGLRGGKQ